MFLKLADKVDVDIISGNFENWPDRIINLSYVPLIAEKPLFDFVISISHSLLIRSDVPETCR